MAMIRCNEPSDPNFASPCTDLSWLEIYVTAETLLWFILIAFVLGSLSGTPSAWRARWTAFRDWFGADDDYEERSVSNLRLLCSKRDLKVSGTKKELVQRLRNSQ